MKRARKTDTRPWEEAMPDPTPSPDNYADARAAAGPCPHEACEKAWPYMIETIARGFAYRESEVAARDARIAELEEEREEARLALGNHRSDDYDNDEGCGCTMYGLVELCQANRLSREGLHDRIDKLDAKLAVVRAVHQSVINDARNNERIDPVVMDGLLREALDA